MITEYELYVDDCDRSIPNKKYKLFGGLICTNKGRERLLSQLVQVRSQYGLVHEMKWEKVSLSYLDRYQAWINVFFEEPFARFSLLKIDTSGKAWEQFRSSSAGGRNFERGKLSDAFYQFLLNSFGELHDTKRWTVFADKQLIYLDEDLTKVEIRFNKTYKKAFGPKSSRIIRFTKSRESHDENLIQLTDVLLGAISYYDLIKGYHNGNAKQRLAYHCENAFMQNSTTRSGVKKIDIRDWVPSDQYIY